MKLKSELYIQELLALLYGLNLQVNDCAKILKRERINAQIISFFMPWRANAAWSALAINAELLTQHVRMVSELREKILLSEGVSSDMKPMTLQQIFNEEGSGLFH